MLYLKILAYYTNFYFYELNVIFSLKNNLENNAQKVITRDI